MSEEIKPSEPSEASEDTELSSGEKTKVSQLMESWHHLALEDKAATFRNLSQDDAEDFFLALTAREQAVLMTVFSRAERRLWIRFLAPDDAADLLQTLTEVTEESTAVELKSALLEMVDQLAKREILALLSYREDEAGGLMSTRFVRVRPDMEVAQAIRYVRQQVQLVEPAHYIYVLDSQQKLLGVLSLRQLFIAPSDKIISEVMETKIITIPEEMDQERLGQVFSQYRYYSLPVVDSESHMRGVVTVDDVLDVSREEATEDIQKIGGMEALDLPYPQVTFFEMFKKRAGWLALLFVGEMFTATAMSHYEDELKAAIVLSLFLPLIISSGGNSGSQASSLIIRSLALNELRISDWWKVFLKECGMGVTLGIVLATIGMLRIWVWHWFFGASTGYGQNVGLLASAVGLSLIGVVCYGSLTGSMLPFLLKKTGLDPATASAPMVATLVDVCGLIIYFTIAKLVYINHILF